MLILYHLNESVNITGNKRKRPKCGKKASKKEKQTVTGAAVLEVPISAPLTEQDASPDLPGLYDKKDDRWFVEKVLDYRVKRNQEEFLVKWEDWDE